MHIENLVSMINDISAFFAGGEAEIDVAAASVESHVARYWEPRMRRQILEHWSAGGEDLTEVSRAALALLAAEGQAASQIHAFDGGTGGDAG